MNWSTLLLILLSVSMSAVAQILLKAGLSPRSGDSDPSGLLQIIARMFLNPWVVGGLGLYFLGALVWLFVLSRAEVSYAYPFVSVGVILTMILGFLVFGEHIGPSRMLGAALIVTGIVFVARS